MAKIDPIPTRNFRSAYACSIPPFEDDSSFSPPICLLTSGGQAFEFYGVDLLNQIWLFSIQFDPLEVRRSLFHTHPTWRITAICRYGQHLLVGTKQGTLFQVSSCDEQILCRLRDREIMKVLKMGDAIVMMDQMDGMWIREKSLQFYDNQRGVRGVSRISSWGSEWSAVFVSFSRIPSDFKWHPGLLLSLFFHSDLSL